MHSAELLGELMAYNRPWIHRVERYWLWSGGAVQSPSFDPMLEQLWEAGETDYWPMAETSEAEGWERVQLCSEALNKRYGTTATKLYAEWWGGFVKKAEDGGYLTDVELAMLSRPTLSIAATTSSNPSGWMRTAKLAPTKACLTASVQLPKGRAEG